MTGSALDYATRHRVSWPIEAVDKALWTIALCGGSVSAAHQILEEEGPPEGCEMITRQTLNNWRSRYFRNRYHEIIGQRTRELDQVIADDSSVLAQRIAQSEERAVKQIDSGLPHATAAEAAQILLSLSRSKQVQLQEARTIREAPLRQQRENTIERLAASLERVAGGSVIEIVEGTAEEIAPKPKQHSGVGATGGVDAKDEGTALALTDDELDEGGV
jgi:hypothetical protein